MSSDFSGPESKERLEHARELVEKIDSELNQTIIGQENLRRRLIQALITGGHILLEGVPGLAKTLSISALSHVVDGSFKRIQFTPDLLPSDVKGSEVFRPENNTFEIRKGPIFANFVLADEINRAPAKVQSALLETMQEHQVTIGDTTLKVPSPFLVMATQNPVEQEGTYPLPEAQVDRFMMKVLVDYPSKDDELKILERVTDRSFEKGNRPPVSNLEEIAIIKDACEQVYLDQKIKQYIVSLVAASRKPEEFGIKASQYIELGASPRAAIALFNSSRAEALMQGQHFVVPQHVKNVAKDVLRHRVIATYEAEAQGLSPDALVQMLLDAVEVP